MKIKKKIIYDSILEKSEINNCSKSKNNKKFLISQYKRPVNKAKIFHLVPIVQFREKLTKNDNRVNTNTKHDKIKISKFPSCVSLSKELKLKGTKNKNQKVILNYFRELKSKSSLIKNKKEVSQSRLNSNQVRESFKKNFIFPDVKNKLEKFHRIKNNSKIEGGFNTHHFSKKKDIKKIIFRKENSNNEINISRFNNLYFSLGFLYKPPPQQKPKKKFNLKRYPSQYNIINIATSINLSKTNSRRNIFLEKDNFYYLKKQNLHEKCLDSNDNKYIMKKELVLSDKGIYEIPLS